MKTSTIKNIIKDNKNSLIGKTLIVNGKIFTTLRGFGQSILDFEGKGCNVSMSVQKDGESLSIYNKPQNVRRALKMDFDTINIFAYKVNIERAVQQFGTSA